MASFNLGRRGGFDCVARVNSTLLRRKLYHESTQGSKTRWSIELEFSVAERA